MKAAAKKWVGVTMDTVIPTPVESRDKRLHSVQEKYISAIAEVTGAVVVALPSFGEDGPAPAPAELIERLDGLLFTGAISNVHPPRYGEAPSPAAEPYDPQRDASTLPLLEHAIAVGFPTFCICRGFQELNVACGGTLFPRVHEVAGRQDHRKPNSADFAVQYGPKHSLVVTPGGYLDRLVDDAGLARPLMVNSLHYQAVNRLGKNLSIEATAEDGTVEAMRLTARPDGSAPGYCFAAQWHPEYQANRNPLSRLLFQDFASAL